MTLNGGRGSNIKYTPFAFTKEGVTVLKTLMKSQVEVNFSEDPSLPAIAENCWNEGTVVLYQPDDTLNIEVRVDDETVWLTQEQIAQLFRTTRNNISIHINNIFVENELEKGSVCKDSLLTATDGKMYQTRLYNLDVIISVGYRVKSVTGVRFRQWANKVMRNYILKKGSYEERLIALEVNHRQTTKILNEHQKQLDIIIKTSIPPKQTIFKDGQIYDAYVLISNLIESANHRVILIDNYINTQVLTLLDKRKEDVKATIYTYPNHIKDPIFRLDIEKHNKQYAPINVLPAYKIHDRFLIIDDDIYASGASIKDAGVHTFAILKIDPVVSTAEELLAKISK